jgi:hypothetical protein
MRESQNQIGDFGWMKFSAKAAAAIAFLLLTVLAFEVHELSHHFFGWAICGAPGTISFTQFEVAPGCGLVRSRLTELFGPLVSMALAYGGAYLVRRRASLFGFGLIFASYFHLRFLPPLLGGGNDELDLARQTGFLHGSRFGVAVILFVLSLPPLWIAWRALRGRWKAALFALAYVLPVVVLAVSDKVDAFFTGAHPALPTLASATFLSVPLIVLFVNLAVAIAFILVARWFSQMVHKDGP